MSVMVGIGRGAQEGVLIRNAEAMEIMEKITTVVVDKTGTLTEGKPRLTQILPVSGVSDDELLFIAASVEQNSEHHLAAAIVRGAKERGVKFLLSTQRADGSWYVRSRAVKFQPFFEGGFPYGHDQWISSMATGWATAALAHAVPDRPATQIAR